MKNRSQRNAAAAIARAESTQRPHERDLAVALWSTKSCLAEYDTWARRYGAVWTAWRLRFATKRLQSILDGTAVPGNRYIAAQQYRAMTAQTEGTR
jgi:hypothetical protein